MEDDKLDLFYITSLIVIFLSYALFVLFIGFEMWMAACVALGALALSLVIMIVLVIIKRIRFRKQVKKWKQGNY